MPEPDRYIPGVPCWIDTLQPDPERAVAFYEALFGWEFEDVRPPEAPGRYFVARLHGGDVAAVSAPADGEAAVAAWNTYVWVDSAEDTAAKVRAAGGRVTVEAVDVGDAGRMAVFSDPDGAELRAWQANRHRGAQVVNEPGSLNFNGLGTRDAAGAAEFYGAVFGWETLPLGDDAAMWRLPGYGDFLESASPGLRERMAEMGAPAGFEDVVAALEPLTGEGASARWGVTFATDDADATADRAAQLGGRVLVAPFDAPWVRTTVIADPQGATFTASKFVPENKDLGREQQASARAA